MAKKKVSFERVTGGGCFPRFSGEEPKEYWKKVEQHAETMRRCGITHLPINDAVVSIPLIMDPENSYLRFTTYAHPMDRYVTSTYKRGHLSSEPPRREPQAAALEREDGQGTRFWLLDVVH